MQHKSIHILLEACQHIPREPAQIWRLRLMATNHALQPHTVKTLEAAFHSSWGFISKDPHFATKDPARLQRYLSECLMQLGADGERDPLRLANAAINRMRREFSFAERVR
jgi:hypothetical protein